MRKRTITGLAAILAVVAVFALGPAGTSAAPGDNAVVHWSGVAASAIAVGRAPASSSVSAAWCTVRCTTPSPPSREVSSRSRPA
jgi:hypothetical protein